MNRQPRLTDRILEALIQATGEALAGAYEDTRTPAEARALEDADAWAHQLREFRGQQKGRAR